MEKTQYLDQNYQIYGLLSVMITFWNSNCYMQATDQTIFVTWFPKEMSGNEKRATQGLDRFLDTKEVQVT